MDSCNEALQAAMRRKVAAESVARDLGEDACSETAADEVKQ